MENPINAEFLSKGVLLMLDTPPNMEFGIDNTSWRVQDKFKGIKMIPLGPHYMHYALADEDHKFRTGRFLFFSESKKVIVLKWSPQVQDFMYVSPSEEASYVHGVRSFYFDCYLGPYPNERTAVWVESSNYITKQVLEKLDPLDTIYSLDEEYDSKAIKAIEQQPEDKEGYSLDGQEAEEQQQDGQQQMETGEVQESQEQTDKKTEEQKTAKREEGKFRCVRGTIYYTEVPKKLNNNLQETTEVNIDKTKILLRMLEKEYKNNQDILLGEIQYAFIVFLLGEDLESFEQWKRLINVVVMSENALGLKTSLYMKFIVVLFTQIKQFPKDFFVSELSKDNFMVGCLRRLVEYEEDSAVDSKLRKRIGKVRDLVQKNFGFIIPEEDEQDMPTVLEEDSQYY